MQNNQIGCLVKINSSQCLEGKALLFAEIRNGPTMFESDADVQWMTSKQIGIIIGENSPMVSEINPFGYSFYQVLICGSGVSGWIRSDWIEFI